MTDNMKHLLVSMCDRVEVEYRVSEVAEMYDLNSDEMHLEEIHRLLTDFQGIYVSLFGTLPRIRP
jgi:hypothetical protein